MPAERTQEEAVARADRWLARRDAIGTKLSTWLLFGNAGALLICFNALLDHKVCSWAVFSPLVWSFAIGLAAAFASTLCAWLSAFFTQRDLSTLTLLATQASINEREFEQLKAADDLDNATLYRFEASNREVNEKMNGIMRRSWRSTASELAGGLAWAIGVVALVFGLIASLADPRYAAALCPA